MASQLASLRSRTSIDKWPNLEREVSFIPTNPDALDFTGL